MIRPLTVVGSSTHQLVQRDLAFVLVAVISSQQQDGRSGAVPNDTDRHGNHTPGRLVAGIRKAENADLLPINVKVDVRRYVGLMAFHLVAL